MDAVETLMAYGEFDLARDLFAEIVSEMVEIETADWLDDEYEVTT